MNYTITAYIVYFLVLVFIVLYIGAVLYKNGRPFLINTFAGDASLADSVNKFLLAGYYLLNIGYTILFLKISNHLDSMQAMVNLLAIKAGSIILILGIMHFTNVLILVTIGKNKKPKQL